MKIWQDPGTAVHRPTNEPPVVRLAMAGMALLLSVAPASDAIAAQSFWLFQTAGDHPVFALVMFAVAALVFFLGNRLIRLWRSNKNLQAIAEERIGVIDSLIENESQLQHLTDISPVGVLFVDAEGTCFYVNRRFELISGRSAASLSESGWQIALHADDRGRVLAQWESNPNIAAPILFEARVVTPGDQTIWILGQAAAQRDEHGGIVGYVLTITDITERKNLEQALAERDARFRASERIAKIGHWERDFRTGEIYWSKQVFHTYGLDPDDDVPDMEDIYQRMHPDDRDNVRAVSQRVVEQGGRYEIEHRILLPDGAVRWVHVQAEMILNDAGSPVMFRGTIQDITDIRHTREALHRSEERFRSVFEASGTGLMITDRDGRYTRVNRAFCKLMGYEEAELLQLRRADLAHPDDIENVHEVYRQLFSREVATHARESRYIRKDGEVVWAVITSVLVEGGEGQEPRLINNLLDITERKAAERALAENEARLVRAQRIADIGDWERDIKTGEITWSAQTPRILGLNDAERGVHFGRFLELTHPDDRKNIFEGNRSAIEEGRQLGQEYRIVRPDNGEIRYVRSEAEVTRDEHGKAIRIVGTLQDITRLRLTESALLQSEARFRGMFDAGATGVILTSMKDYAVQVNKAFEDFVGYPEEEILKMAPLALVHPADRAAALASRQDLLERRYERIYSERRFIHRDGSIRWADVAIALLDMPDNEEQFSIVAVQDITDRKRADEELARKTKLLDLVREIALAANQATEYEEVVRFCLDRVCAFTGWPVGHAYLITDDKNSGVGFLPIWHLSDPDKYAPFVEASEEAHVRPGIQLPGEVLEKGTVVWREKIPRRDAGNESRGRAVRRVGLKSGFGAPVMVGNEVVAVVEFFSDKTTPYDEDIVNAMKQIGTEIGRVFERKRAERQLMRSEQQLRQVVDNAPLWIYVKDIEGRYLLANDAMGSLYNMTAEEIIGKRQQDIYPHPEMMGRIKETDRDVIESGQAKIFPEWQLYRHDGEERCMRLVKMPYTLQDGTICVLGIALDITDEKRAEEERWRAQRLDALGQMTGGVAHDFNNLLTIILGNLQLLGRRLDDPGLLKLTGAAERAARRGGDVTGRLLAFARSQPLEPQAVNLNALVNDVIPLVERTVGQGIEIECNYGAELQSALADPAQIESALINLTANARDAMPEGGKITITTGNVEVTDRSSDQGQVLSPGRYVMLSVRDNGTGMDSDVAARALEPFFTTKEVGKGSGLGLPSVYGFAEQSGGGVTIDSDPGVGTCVSVYLPQTGESATEAPLSSVRDSSGRQEIVLLVEDDPDVRDYARAVLANLNYRVVEAANGEEALAILRGTQPLDLLFSDVILPGEIDGRGIARQALKMRPDLKVILTSGNWDLSSPNGMPMLEGAAVLPKPYTEEKLADIIRKVLTRPEPLMAGE